MERTRRTKKCSLVEDWPQHACFVTKALEDLIAANCISIVHSSPWVVNPLTVSVRAEGKKRLVLDLRYANPHLFKYKFKCEDISTAQQLL